MTADLAAFAAAAAAGTLTDEQADRWLLHVTAPTTSTVPGADLHPGSVVIDIAGDAHRIDHLTEYPGRAFLGDHARRAYEQADEQGWCCTVCDREPFHVKED